MNTDSVIIVGAGLAGLAAGCFAQMNGYQSHIFEHHSQPGGVVAAWKRKDYLIDGGIHFVMNYKPGTGLYELYRQLGIIPANNFVDLHTYGRFVDEASGHSIVISHDLDRTAEALKALSPVDAGIVDELIAGSRAFQGLDMSELGLGKPPELAGALDQLKDLWAMRRQLKYLTGKYGQPVADYARAVQDPMLRSSIESLFLPQVPVYFIFMLFGLLAGGQMGLIEGGSLEFVRSIERHYLALGGEITYRATVEDILVKADPPSGDDRAVGVRLADGTEHRAGAVISAADGRSTIFRMLCGSYVNDKIEARYASWPTFAPLLLISYGVAREFPDDPAFTTIALKRPLIIGGKAVEWLMLRLFNYSPRFAPPGKTMIQAEIETEWDHWYDLQQNDRAAYEAEKERVAAEVLDRLEVHYPGLVAQVEVTDVATPYTTWRYTLNHRGAWEGWLMTPETLRTVVERTLPGLADFYMAGQWVMPGGGVSPCLYSGRHAVQLLCKRDGKPFTAELQGP